MTQAEHFPVFTDKALQRRIRRIGRIPSHGLVCELYNLGGFLSLRGNFELGLSCWRRAYDTRLSRQLHGDEITSWYDAPVESVAQYLEYTDFTSANPLVGLSWFGGLLRAPRHTRTVNADRDCRRQLSRDPWTTVRDVSPRLTEYRNALRAIREARGGTPPTSAEHHALETLFRALNSPEELWPSDPDASRDGLLLTADLAARAGLKAQTRRALKAWRNLVRQWQHRSDCLQPLVLTPLLEHVATGALSSGDTNSLDSLRRRVDKALSRVDLTIAEGSSHSSQCHRWTTYTHHAFLTMGPPRRDSDLEQELLQEAIGKPPLAARNDQAAIYYKSDDWICDIQVELDPQSISTRNALLVGHSTLIVGSSGILIGDDYDPKLRRLNIPAGAYDVTARVFKQRRDGGWAGRPSLVVISLVTHKPSCQ